MSDTTVVVGMTYSSDAASFARVLNPNAAPGDPVAIARTIERRVNAEGGILGRKLKVELFDQPIRDQAADANAQASAACAYFTQDHPVAWVVINTATQIDAACLARAKTPSIELNAILADRQSLEPWAPYYHLAGNPDPSALWPRFVDRLVAQGYFGGWDPRTQTPNSNAPVIGVFLPDTALHERVLENFVKPALKRRGLSVAATYAGDPNPVARSSQEQSVILQFRSKGVTHLLTLGPAVYSGAKGEEGWHPRLGLTSDNGPSGLAAGLEPAALKGAAGLGWSYVADTGPNGAGAPSAKTNKCLGWIAKDLGYDMQASPDQYGSAVTKCDGFIVFIEAMRAAGGFSFAHLQAGLTQTHLKTPTAYMSSQGFTATNHYGPGTARDLVYTSSCTCFRYGTTVTRF